MKNCHIEMVGQVIKEKKEHFLIKSENFWSVKAKNEPPQAAELRSLPFTSIEAQWSQKPPARPQEQVDVAD